MSSVSNRIGKLSLNERFSKVQKSVKKPNVAAAGAARRAGNVARAKDARLAKTMAAYVVISVSYGH